MLSVEIKKSNKKIETNENLNRGSVEEKAKQQIELQKQIDELRLQVKAKKDRLLAIIVPRAQASPVSGTCQDWMNQAGITDQGNAYTLIMRESGCNPNAVNKSSGACGIPQALPCSKLGTSDPVEQLRWMQNYVVRRYGSWANAVAHSTAHNWY